LSVTAAAALPAVAPGYEFPTEHDPDGIGKVYLGREIARITGPDGIAWFDRPQREETEPRSRIIEALQLRGGEVVADLGAGSGYYTFALATAVGPKGTVLAVEVQEEMLAALRKKAGQLHATNVGLIRGRPDDPRLPAGRVDLVLMVGVYHELEFPFEVMTKVVRALKPGGRVAIIEHRAEDPEVQVKPLHKMTEIQIRKEMQAVGLEHTESVDILPRQHLLIFQAVQAPPLPPPQNSDQRPQARAKSMWIDVVAGSARPVDVLGWHTATRHQVANLLSVELRDPRLQSIDPVQAQDPGTGCAEQGVMHGRAKFADYQLRGSEKRDLLGDGLRFGFDESQPLADSDPFDLCLIDQGSIVAGYDARNIEPGADGPGATDIVG
jgi:ubiquinone/menaquinone biosynthesis C-methylase UbiE